MLGSGPAAGERGASVGERERAIRLLWLSNEFDPAAIAALLGIGEGEVQRAIALREADITPSGVGR